MEPLASNVDNRTVILPEGFKYDILYTAFTDSVERMDGKRFPARNYADFTAYIPINGSSNHGYLYVNHESRDLNDNLGDGGGGAILEITKENGTWKTLSRKHIDFNPVGGSLRNCGGTLTPQNTILTAEETEPINNAALRSEYRDTSDFNGLKRHQNFGWMVEVNPMTGKAMHKLYAMGRYQHEDAHIMPDNKTIYLTDDASPCVFFKFVADMAGKYTAGQLYAYKQSSDGESGEWLALPRDRDSLVIARDVAARLGATLFIRHEWVDGVGDKLYITETGNDKYNTSYHVGLGAKQVNYLTECCDKGSNNYADPYGRVLELDLKTMKIRPLVKGGDITGNLPGNFASPDGLTLKKLNGKNYLVISEDLIGINQNRVGQPGIAKNEVYNEIYFLDLGNPNPTTNDLMRFAIGPEGCETTGTYFTPDGKTMFVSIHMPSTTNPEPFNKSIVLAITGF
ncbi:hypothetical protein BH09BAC1_BH09BAC1_30310 [soil metagenome]